MKYQIPTYRNRMANVLRMAPKAALVIGAGYLFLQDEVKVEIHLQPAAVVSQKTPVDEQDRGQGESANQPLSEQKEAEQAVGWRSLTASLFGMSSKMAGADKKNAPRYSDEDVDAFVERFGHVAQSEMRKYGVPASIVLAQGLLHSQAGRQPVHNNYFRVPCGNARGGQDACLEKFTTAWSGFRGHSEYLAEHRHLFPKGGSPKAWARALEESGLWPNANLASQLMALVEKYGLAAYDR